MNEPELNLRVRHSELNGILTALGQLPYVQVAALIQKITVQAQQQLTPKESAQDAHNEPNSG